MRMRRPLLPRELLRGALAAHLVASGVATEQEPAAATAAHSAVGRGVADDYGHEILVRRLAYLPIEASG